MNKALFAALASVALLGASCSVQDFSIVVMDKPTITASLDVSNGALNPNGNTRSVSSGGMSFDEALGDYSFTFGLMSVNLVNYANSTAGYYLDGSGSLVANNSFYISPFIPVVPNGTYNKSGFGAEGACQYGSNGQFIRSSSMNGTITIPSDCYFVRFNGIAGNAQPMFVEGSSVLAYEPFAYGFSFSTPFSASRSFYVDYASNAPSANSSYSVVEDGVTLCDVSYGYSGVYFDLHFFDHANAVKFKEYFDEYRVASRTHLVSFNTSYIAGGDTGTIFHFGFDVAFSSGSMLDDFTYLLTLPNQEGYDVGFDAGYYDAMRDNGIFNHAFSLTASDGTDTITNYIDDSLLEWYASANTQGLFDPYDLVSFLGLSSSATSYSIIIQYGEVYASSNFPLAAFPLYVDVLADGVVEDTLLCPYLSISTYRGGSIRGNTLFAADFTTSYAGLAVGYTNDVVYNREYDSFNRISLVLPKNQSYADMREIGVVSPYAQGYADGLASRDGEVGDLTDRIRNLEVDLSQYQGKTYEQIYNLGLQAGLDENAQGAATFNSLFGNILTAPLTILNGLTDISFFGMPILTAILSLLMVAMALFLFKRFK